MLFSWVIGKTFIFESIFVILLQLSIVLQFTIVQTALGANYTLVLLNFRMEFLQSADHKLVNKMRGCL